MKKHVEKMRVKPAAKAGTARKAKPRAAADPHDHLHSLLRGAHAHRVCGPRTP
jgi:transcriptional regulator of NAD metabolism